MVFGLRNNFNEISSVFTLSYFSSFRVKASFIKVKGCSTSFPPTFCRSMESRGLPEPTLPPFIMSLYPSLLLILLLFQGLASCLISLPSLHLLKHCTAVKKSYESSFYGLLTVHTPRSRQDTVTWQKGQTQLITDPENFLYPKK